MEIDDFLSVPPIPEDWGGDGQSRMSLSGRRTAISDEYKPREYLLFDSNLVSEENDWKIPGMPENLAPITRRLLSWHDCGASTAKVVFPPEFTAPEGIFTADLEIFVLTGEVQVGEWKLPKHGYSFIPAGVKVGKWKVLGNQPVELLWMENGPVPLQYKSVQNTLADARIFDYIPAMDTKLLPWATTNTVQFEVAKKKWLRRNQNNSGVWLLAILPHYDGQFSIIQAYNEDDYCLSGYLDLGDYRVQKDGYCYCPSFSLIPRHISDEGCLFFVRVDRDLSKLGTVISYKND